MLMLCLFLTKSLTKLDKLLSLKSFSAQLADLHLHTWLRGYLQGHLVTWKFDRLGSNEFTFFIESGRKIRNVEGLLVVNSQTSLVLTKLSPAHAPVI